MMPQSGVSPLDLQRFPRCKGVADVIYNPLRTRLCQQAAELGIPACGGLLMLAAQAAAAEYAFGTAGAGRRNGAAVYRELLAERRNLVFIGMPGSGKDHHRAVGRPDAGTGVYRLRRGVPAGVRHHPGGELLAHGELYFREREEALLRKLSPKTGCVIAAGGGPSCGRKMWEALRGKQPAVLAAAAAGAAAHRGAAAFPPTCRGCTGSGSRCTGLRRIFSVENTGLPKAAAEAAVRGLDLR